jgi:monoamine oxidase
MTSGESRNTTPLDVIIVGGGLSGLIVARNLSKNKRWKLLEASENLGGRLRNDIAGNSIDLGGAWIWPHQHQMANLVDSLGIGTFLQPGDSSSIRIVGGAADIVKRIVDELCCAKSSDDHDHHDDHHEEDAHRIETNCPVVACRRISESLVSVELASGRVLRAKHVCFACPPKLIDLHIQFYPSLPSTKSRAMASSQTWMAGVTKVALVYHSPPFWPIYESNGGFQPGEHKPAFQFYDASPEDGSVCALTFFTLASLSNAENDDAMLARDCAEQMCSSLSNSTLRNFPNIVQHIRGYDEIHVKRWPQEKYISEDAHPTGITPHPEPDLELAKPEWNGMLLFAGTETDLVSPGVMEGAVNSAVRVTNELLQSCY